MFAILRKHHKTTSSNISPALVCVNELRFLLHVCMLNICFDCTLYLVNYAVIQRDFLTWKFLCIVHKLQLKKNKNKNWLKGKPRRRGQWQGTGKGRLALGSLRDRSMKRWVQSQGSKAGFDLRGHCESSWERAASAIRARTEDAAFSDASTQHSQASMEAAPLLGWKATSSSSACLSEVRMLSSDYVPSWGQHSLPKSLQRTTPYKDYSQALGSTIVGRGLDCLLTRVGRGRGRRRTRVCRPNRRWCCERCPGLQQHKNGGQSPLQGKLRDKGVYLPPCLP